VNGLKKSSNKANQISNDLKSFQNRKFDPPTNVSLGLKRMITKATLINTGEERRCNDKGEELKFFHGTYTSEGRQVSAVGDKVFPSHPKLEPFHLSYS
jgi:hypothetical protein